MKRHLFLAAALLAAFASAPVAHAQVSIGITLTLDKDFVPCSGTTDEKTIHATATCVGTQCTAQHRVRFTQTGPNVDSDGHSAFSQSTLATIGSDLTIDWSRLIHCDEWGYYNIKAELVQPSSQGSATIVQDDEDYEATYRSPLRIDAVNSFSNTCSSVTMGITVTDQDLRLVKGMPLVWIVNHGNGSGGIAEGTTGTTVSTAGKLTMTVPVVPNLNNGGGVIQVEHASIHDTSNFLDPFFYNEVVYIATGCP